MTPIRAVLVKRQTDDGLIGVKSTTPLGKVYLVDLESVSTETLYNTILRKRHVKEIIMVLDGDDGYLPIAWMPTELLRIES
jgi:hypothetical protein